MSEKCSALFSYTDCIPTVSVYVCVWCVCVCTYLCVIPVRELPLIDLIMGIIKEYLIMSKYGPKAYSTVSSSKPTKTFR